MQFAGSTAVSLAGQRGRRGLFLAQSNPAPKKPASTTPLRMAPVALAVEGPGSGASRIRGETPCGFSPEGKRKT